MDISTHIKIKGMKQAQPPQIYHDKLILSYDSDHFVRFVGAAFEHEDYNKIHTFRKNEYDVYFLVMPLHENRTTYFYRLIVDGLWMPDPANSRTIRDENGIIVSVFTVSRLPDRPITGPKIGENGRVTFYFKGPENRVVYLTGSFNNWEPFMYRLRETKPGLYSITITLREGDHFYYFISNGRKMLDPFNTERGTDDEGILVSYLKMSEDNRKEKKGGILPFGNNRG